jgi:hypothetical protein
MISGDDVLDEALVGSLGLYEILSRGYCRYCTALPLGSTRVEVDLDVGAWLDLDDDTISSRRCVGGFFEFDDDTRLLLIETLPRTDIDRDASILRQ